MSAGCTLADKHQSTGKVTVNPFGEGTTSQSDFMPSVEKAVLWNLPVIFVCDNNQYVELDSQLNVSTLPDVALRVECFGMPFEIDDGNDFGIVWALTRAPATQARNRVGPTFLELKTYRRGTHYTGDPGGG